MGILSIKVKIADREYPMKVQASEEERIRLAGKLVNEQFKAYRERFKIDDKQDLLAMVAFDCLIEKMRSESEKADSDDFISRKLTELDGLVSSVLLE